MSIQENRKARRVSDAMALRVEKAIDAIGHSQLDNVAPTHVVNLSNGGMRFLHDKDLPVNETLLLTMCLGPNRVTVSLHAEVISSVEQKKPSHKQGFNARVRFKNVDHSAKLLLEQHISHVLNQTYRNHPQFDFKASA